MQNINDNEPAFPRNHNHHGHNGLTKREYFASIALQGLLAKYDLGEEGAMNYACEDAVNLADTLISELNKPVKN